jgi:penicillin-insensitive murein DD-endopeptidase
MRDVAKPTGRLMRYLSVLFVAVALPMLLVPAVACALAFMAIDDGKPSVCYGNIRDGRLENAKRLLYAGANYRAYHIAGFVTGRTFMHSAVRDAARDAYAALAASDPELRFVYAEASWRNGGRLWPHRTHSNGTSVDFMVPLRTDDGAVTQINASVLNMLGYSIKFDDEGRRGRTRIDFEAMAKHLLALDAAARIHGIHIRRVIFEPPLHRFLFATEHGKLLRERMAFMTSRAWVRHDQHYHVDFDVPCEGGGKRKKRADMTPPATHSYIAGMTAMSVTSPGRSEMVLPAIDLPLARSTE